MRFMPTEDFLTQKKLYFRFLKEKKIYDYYKSQSLSDDKWVVSHPSDTKTILDKMSYEPYDAWITCSFSWIKTSQGSRFWSNISRQFRTFMSNIKEELTKNAHYEEL